MRCLIVGASGQVGGWLVQGCQLAGWDWLGTGQTQAKPPLLAVDLRDPTALPHLIAEYRPDYVFLAAAFTHVDRAESHPEECFAVNVAGTERLAQALSKTAGRLVFFSTDHVFSDSDRANREDDPPAPLSVYARSKVLAEQCIREILPDRHLILRTSWVFGPEKQGKNFVYRALRTLQQGQPLLVARDQYGQPTFAPDLARVAMQLALGGDVGTWHAVGPDRLTRFAFARLIAHLFGLDCNLVRGLATADLQQPAPRPGKVWLSRFALSQRLGSTCIRSAAEGLRAMREQLGLTFPTSHSA